LLYIIIFIFYATILAYSIFLIIKNKSIFNVLLIIICNLICIYYVSIFALDLPCYLAGGVQMSSKIEVISDGRARGPNSQSVSIYDDQKNKYWGIGSISIGWKHPSNDLIRLLIYQRQNSY